MIIKIWYLAEAMQVYFTTQVSLNLRFMPYVGPLISLNFNTYTIQCRKKMQHTQAYSGINKIEVELHI